LKESNLSIHYQQLPYQELSEKDRQSLDHARLMADKAYAPYSNFFVGASALLSNGKRMGGNNQENAAYPSGLCAERVALFSAKSNYPNLSVESLSVFIPAISDPTIPSPCGACRQVISEVQFAQEDPIRLLLMNSSETVWIFSDASDLLPFSFTAHHLK
jgi:cytidine deaminase